MEQDSAAREPMAAPDGRSLRWAAWLLMAGGILAVATLTLGWARVSYPSPGATYTVEAVGHVRAGVLLGAFMLVAGGIGLIVRSSDARRAWLVTGIAAGLALGGVAVFDLLTGRTRVVDDLVRTSGDNASAAGLIQYSVRAGIFVALIAAAFAVVAGIVLLLAGRQEQSGGPAGGPEQSAQM